MPKVKNAEVKSVQISAKCSDLCFTTLLDEHGETVAYKEGYVPSFMPDDHYGDYIILDIDVETGTIKNWRVPSSKQMIKDLED